MKCRTRKKWVKSQRKIKSLLEVNSLRKILNKARFYSFVLSPHTNCKLKYTGVEMFSGTPQTSKMENFVTIVNS